MPRVERTIKHYAKELAGKFYEDNRTEKFRRAFPAVGNFMSGVQIMYDKNLNVIGRKKVPAGWVHFITLARKTLTMMLGQPDARIGPAMKEKIYDAILEDRRLTTPAVKTPHVHQRKNLDG